MCINTYPLHLTKVTLQHQMRHLGPDAWKSHQVLQIVRNYALVLLLYLLRCFFYVGGLLIMKAHFGNPFIQI